MKSVLKWAALNGSLVACTWAGWWVGVEGARNVVAAFVVVCAVIGGCMLFADPRRFARKAALPRTLRTGSAMVAWFTLSTLIWHGAFVTGTLWSMWMLMSYSINCEVQALRAKQAEAACSGN